VYIYEEAAAEIKNKQNRFTMTVGF